MFTRQNAFATIEVLQRHAIGLTTKTKTFKKDKSNQKSDSEFAVAVLLFLSGGNGRYAGKDKNTKRKGVSRGSTSQTPQLATIYTLLITDVVWALSKTRLLAKCKKACFLFCAF